MLILIVAVACLAGAALRHRRARDAAERDRAGARPHRAADYGAVRHRGTRENAAAFRERVLQPLRGQARRPDAPRQPTREPSTPIISNGCMAAGMRKIVADDGYPRHKGLPGCVRRPCRDHRAGISIGGLRGLLLTIAMRRRRLRASRAVIVSARARNGADAVHGGSAGRARPALAVSVEAGHGLRRRDREADRAHGRPARSTSSRSR